eukprot:2209722-Pyramimonas_sp.AAC.1
MSCCSTPRAVSGAPFRYSSSSVWPASLPSAASFSGHGRLATARATRGPRGRADGPHLRITIWASLNVINSK